MTQDQIEQTRTRLLVNTMLPFLIFVAIFFTSCSTSSTSANTMTLEELLKKERTQYITTFQLGVSQNKTAKPAIEVMLQITADQNKTYPEIYQLYRYDLINVTADGKYNITEFNLDKDSLLKFEEQVFHINGMEVRVNPFVWNSCELIMDKKPDFAFEQWARKWIDMGDKKPVTADGLQQAIHNVTFPEESNGEWSTAIDLGSAPIEAFKELMQVLSKQGIKRIEVSSRAFLK